MKEAIVLFSGGKDSLLATVRYLDAGYKVYLIIYENSCGIGINNAKNTSTRLIRKYGNDKVVLLGVKDISPIFRTMIYPFYNYEINEIYHNFGNISISQFNCLACRTSMYVNSIILCKQYNVKEVVDGARSCQIFAIEQKEMLEEYRKLFHKYGIDIQYPLENLEDDWKLKNELLMRGMVPKTIEPQCLLGCPLSKEDINKEIIEAVVNVYRNYLLEKVEKCIEDFKDIKHIGDYH